MKLLNKLLLALSVLMLILTCTNDNNPEKFILSVTITPEDGGSVSPEGGTFDEGTVVTLTGVPSEGYVFKEWTGDLKSTNNPVSVTMISDMAITLVFVKSDGDNDGVPDIVDECPNSPAGEEVDETGCSSSQVDADGDGVFNNTDTCPDTPEGEEVDENGCSASQTDTDEDGVADDVDLCANTPSGIAVDAYGCPVTSPIYLDANGITIKCHDWGVVGEQASINGVVYTIVDEARLRQMVSNEEDVTKVCTTKVDDMSQLFQGSWQFNLNISSWDVSNVTDMSNMFRFTTFNQPIGVWDVSAVSNMYGMFYGNFFFDQEIGSWNVGNVTNMGSMFGGDLYFSNGFNQDINTWDVSKVTDMSNMFAFSLFNQNIGSWDVSSVTDMSRLFYFSRFNQPIGNWDVSNVTDMHEMFLISQYNQPLGNWNVGSVTNMNAMFSHSQFNQPIGNWDVSKVTDMSSMFLGNWALGAVNPFNQDIGSWDVSNVTDMAAMFKESSMNQDLSTWNVLNVVSCSGFSENTPDWTLPKPIFTNCSVD